MCPLIFSVAQINVKQVFSTSPGATAVCLNTFIKASTSYGDYRRFPLELKYMAILSALSLKVIPFFNNDSKVL